VRGNGADTLYGQVSNDPLNSRDGISANDTLEGVMNSIRNGLGMRKTEIVKDPSRLWNPHFYAVFAHVHNTL
jgi:hypothetical protein